MNVTSAAPSSIHEITGPKMLFASFPASPLVASFTPLASALATPPNRPKGLVMPGPDSAQSILQTPGPGRNRPSARRYRSGSD